MPTYELLALKITNEKMKRLDALLQMTAAGGVPGHRYPNRADFQRAAHNKLLAEIAEELEKYNYEGTPMAEAVKDALKFCREGINGAE